MKWVWPSVTVGAAHAPVPALSGTVTVVCIGEGSTLPAASTALESTVCSPTHCQMRPISPAPLSVNAGAQRVGTTPSIEHAKYCSWLRSLLTSGISHQYPRPLISFGGPSGDVSGGVVSTMNGSRDGKAKVSPPA